MSGEKLPSRSTRAEIDVFLRQVASTPVRNSDRGGRLLFALDATASREPTWDSARQIQNEMFSETVALGGLSVQLCYYRGFNEFVTSPWLNDSGALLERMNAVHCMGGYTQIERVLSHARQEAQRCRISALVFIGDCMEEEVERLCQLAGELGILGVPVFVFQEGYDAPAKSAFCQIATLTNGAYCRFDSDSAEQLRDLLSAVAVYAAGGQRALEDFTGRRGGIARQLSHQTRED